MLSLKIRGYVITTITILGNSFNQPYGTQRTVGRGIIRIFSQTSGF